MSARLKHFVVTQSTVIRFEFTVKARNEKHAIDLIENGEGIEREQYDRDPEYEVHEIKRNEIKNRGNHGKARRKGNV